MNKKKVLIRIGSVLACVLLVGALAIPAFADLPSVNPMDLPAKDLYEFNEYFYKTYISYVGRAGSLLLPSSATDDLTIRAFYENEFFLFGYPLYGGGSGGEPLGLSNFSFDLYNDDDFVLCELSATQVNLAVTWGPYYDEHSKVCWSVPVEYDLGYSQEDDIFTVTVIIDPLGDTVRFVYRSTSNVGEFGELALDEFYIDGVSYVGSNIELQSVAFLFFDESDVDMVSALGRLFFGGSHESLLFPNDYLTSVFEVIPLDDIIQNSYDKGFADGIGSGDFEEAFQQGYDKAVSEIDSGDFGRNFLGGMFAAPFEALNNFTIVSWVDSDGTTTTITLGLVLSAIIGVSLFIWFLKLFAGG